MAGFDIFLKLDGIDGESTTRDMRRKSSSSPTISRSIQPSRAVAVPAAALDGDERSAQQGDGIS
jgi:hypothetical protein